LLIDTSGRKLHTFDFPAIPFFCGDNTSAVLYDYDKRLFTHYVDARKLLELRREANIAAITKDGRYIYYIVNNEDGSTLYSCNVKGMKEKMLAASPGRKMSKLVVSPDGKTVAYSVNPVSLNGHYSYYNEETESFIIYDGKEPVYFGTGRVIEQISDDGKYIYYVEASPVSSELQLYVESA
jgi:Tol biopolymer transport system component